MTDTGAFGSETGSPLGSDGVAAAIDQPAAWFRVNEPNVIFQSFEQEVVAIHLNTGSYHTMPGIAGEAFLLLSGSGASLREMAGKLAARYEADAPAIEEDLKVFIAELQSQSMVVAIDAPAGQPHKLPAAEQLARRAPYAAPRLESFSDLEGLVLIDPVHDVDVAGWPNIAPDSSIKAPADGADAVVLPLMRCRVAGPNIIFERFNNETVAMDLGTGSYHSLSGEAEDIFLLLPSEPTTWEIRDAVARKYTVGTEELESALRDYLNDLVKEGLVLVERLDEEVAGRELHLSEMPQGESWERLPFRRPRIEAFAQPSFDGSFGEETTFSHEYAAEDLEAGRSADHESAEGAGPALYARRRYAIRAGDVIYSTAGGETVISDRDDGKYYKLNQAASDVFALLRHKPDVNQIFAALEHRYVVGEHSLRVALMILLWNLRKVGLVALERGAADEDALEPGAAALPPAGAGPLPFDGFDVAMHHDLRELLRPFNPAHRAPAKPKAFHARQFLMLLENYFEEAAAACGPETPNAAASTASEESFQIAGERLTIRCAGARQTAGLRRAFHHLKAGGAEAGSGLTISAWNNGVVPAGPFLESVLARLYENWSVQCGPRGELLDFDCDQISAIYHPGPDVLSVLDKEQGKAFYLLRDDAPLPFWELSSPFRHILHPWFGTRGLQYTHAGAVGSALGGVLLAGKGGSGKSTTSLLCASAGMLYAADDYCLTRPDDARVFSLYNTAKLKGPEDLERLPEMRGRSFNEDSFEHGGVGKGAFSLWDIWPERMAADLPLRAILLPTVTSETDTRLEPCSPADALLALAPSTLAQLPFSGQTDCLRLAELAEKVPAYRLYLGSGLARIPKKIAEKIGEFAG